MNDCDEHEDYVWHFKLSDRASASDVAAPVEMVREQLEALLRCVALSCNGRELRVTGFHLLDDPGTEYLLRSSLHKTKEP